MRTSKKSVPSWILAAVVFLVAALPRTVDLSTILTVDETKWLDRSNSFITAVRRGQWSETMQSGHPGVTTMWLAGLGMATFEEWWALLGEEEIQYSHQDMQRYLSPARMPVALAAATAIAAIFLLLRRLASTGAALLGALLLALDPFHIAHSRLVHVDALLSVFMMGSTLSFLVFLRTSDRRFLFLSGMIAGLSFLTKVPSLFLVPFVLLLLALRRWRGFQRLGWGPSQGAGLESIWADVRVFLIWSLTSVAVAVLLWPAMWAAPGQLLPYVVDRTAFSVTTAHNPALGYQLLPGYYPAAIIFYSTPVTLAGFIVAAGYLAYTIRQRRTSAIGANGSHLLLLVFGALFIAAMTLGAKKGERYVLPAFVAMDLLAGAGLYLGVALLAWRPRLKYLALGTLIGLSGVLVASAHPYYLAAYNVLLPKPVEAKMGWGEGLELAADYLVRLPAGEIGTVAAWYPEVLSIFYGGPVVGLGERDRPDVTHVVLYRGMLGRAEDSDATEALLEFQSREPEKTISINGLEYVWIHHTGAQNSTLVGGTRFEGQAQLVGVELTPGRPSAGADLLVTLYWKSIEPMEKDLSVFVHVVSEVGALVAQQDSGPNNNLNPTSGWRPGQVIEDEHVVALPASLPAGPYTVLAGLYDWETGERLSAMNSAGLRWPNDAIFLASIEVQEAISG